MNKDSTQAIAISVLVSCFVMNVLARCGPDTIVRIPPGLDHQVVGLGPDPLRLLVAYAPPLEGTESKAGDKG